MRQARWRGFYADAHGRDEITVDAHGNQVTTVVRGVTFTGNGLNDLAPVTALAPDAPFTLYYEALCACTIEWTMPVSFDTAAGVRQADLVCTLTLGDPPERPGLYYENLELSLSWDDFVARTTGPHEEFETAVTDLTAQLPPAITLRACATCRLAAYPPFHGSDFMGGLACFRDNAEAFLAASGRVELHQIWGTRTGLVLETYLCGRYRPRSAAEGGPQADAG